MADFTLIESRAGRKTPWYRSTKAIRQAVMAFFFLFLAHVAWDHQLKGGGPRGTPSVEAYCPFGGLESLYQFLTTGGFVRRIEPSAMIIFAALVVLTLIGSRGFCGWICPFGSLQEWLGMLGKKIFGKRFNPTGAWDRRLKYLKYVILVVIVALTWHLGTLVFRDYDPFLAFFHLGFGMSELPWAYAILGVVLAGSLYIERFFCKYACPLGAVLGILGKLGISKVHRDPTDCKSCNVCQAHCFAHIDFLNTTTIRDSECNHCMECVAHCPKPNVLRVSGWTRSITPLAYGAMLVVGLFGLIGVSQLAGMWQTKPAAVSFTNANGKLDPESIRGWMTLDEISKGYSIPLDTLYTNTGLPRQVSPTTRLNAITREHKVEFEPDKVRDIVRSYVQGAPATAPAAAKKAHSGGEEEVRGYMTLNEIALKTGVPAAGLRKALDLPDSIDARQPVREWMHAHGKSIQDLRDAVAAMRAEKR
jgi:polyferredoxin